MLKGLALPLPIASHGVMKTLLLMRHAKSSWGQSGLEDHDRPLNGRGRMAADTMAHWLARERLAPDHVHISSARRTRETWERMANILPTPPRPEASRALYLSGPDTMLAHLQATPDQANSVLLLAHQPGMSAMAAHMSDGIQDEEAASAFHHYPTAAIAVLECPVTHWRDLSYGTGRFTRFVTPKSIVTNS